MSFVRTLLFLPILIFVSPALLMLALIILIMDTKEGPLRVLLMDEIRAYGVSQGFERFMQNVFIPTYVHNVQSFVLGAAGFLVVTVGLRGLGVLPLEIVYVALAVEFTLLVMWAITVYYTPEEPITESDNVLVHQKPPEPAIDVELLCSGMKELSAHLSLLENRLRMTESRFEQLGKLDGSIQGLTSKLNLIAGDQFNLHVKKEFDSLLAELSQRTPVNEKPDPS
jgi:hypothetical protein